MVNLYDRGRATSQEDPTSDFSIGSMAGLPLDMLESHSPSRSGMPAPGLRTHALKCVNTLSGHHSGIRVIAVLNNRVFTGSYDNTIKVWNLDSGSCEATLEGHVAWIRSLFCHAREPLLFSGSDDGVIKLWCPTRTPNLPHAPTGPVRAHQSACPRPRHQPHPRLRSVGRRTDTHTHVQDLAPPGFEGVGNLNNNGILAIAVDYENGWLIAGSYDSNIYIWALPSCAFLHVLAGHRSAVRSLVIYNGCLMSGSYDRTVKLWRLSDPATCVGSLGTRGSVWALAVHAGMLLGAIGDSSIKVSRRRGGGGGGGSSRKLAHVHPRPPKRTPRARAHAAALPPLAG